MKTVLFAVLLKPGMLESYKKFVAEITGSHKAEFKDLLKRYGWKNAKVWHQRFSGKDYIYIVHDGEADALERLKKWSSSTHPFDLWFGKQLEQCYETFPDPAHQLFSVDSVS